MESVSTSMVLLNGPTSTVATSQFESITRSTIVEFWKSRLVPEFIIESSIRSEDLGSRGMVIVSSESMDVMLTRGPASEFSEIATRAPYDAITDEVVFNSTILVGLPDESTSWRLLDERIAIFFTPFESVGIAMSTISSSKLSAKIG